jgi:hypothetical protein
MNANERLLPAGDRAIRELQELGAAAAHLDGDVAQAGSAEFQPRGLAMIGTADRFQFAGGVPLKFLYRHLQSFYHGNVFGPHGII